MPKITELTEATAVDEDDLLLVIEDGVAKKVAVSDLGVGGEPFSAYTPPPLVSTLSWGLQGTATAVDDDDSFLLSVVNGGTEIARTLHKTVPATPWALTVRFAPILHPVATGYCGLAFRQSSNGITHLFRYEQNGALASTKHDAAGAGSAHYVTPVGWLVDGHRPWFRIEDNGTNRICSVSYDGEEFITFHTVTRTDYLTADQAGVFVGGNNSVRAAMRVLHWTGI